jgi:hypothetical protein
MILKKSLLCLSVLTSCALVHLSAAANEPVTASNATSTTATATKETSSNVEDYITSLYGQIDFGKGEKLNPEVFEKAVTGYLNLQSAGKLSNNREILSVVDFTKSSTTNRLWIIDMKAKKVIYNTYVAHGQGSGMDVPNVFSNQDGTHASSLGFYVTSDTYMGQHGNSLRLNGMDQGFNDAALARGIVVHAANYVSKANIAGQGRLGRSWGCPAVAPELAQPIINTIKGGTCLFIYSAQPKYLKSAYWVNKKLQSIPGAAAADLQLAAVPTKANQKIAGNKVIDTSMFNRL